MRLVAACCALSASMALAEPPALMPWPARVEESSGSLPVRGPFAVTWSGHRDARLERAVERFATDVQRRTGLLRRAAGPALEIDVASGGAAWPALETRESYTLSIQATGVRIAAHEPVGVLRALATLRQLIVPGADGYSLPWLTIDDAPRFAWRGLMLDVARHFLGVATLERQIDAMERVKLNVLHLHLSDNEAFRVESRRYPRLTAWASHPGRYTQAEIRALTTYAADRGVRVVPEFDVPGHTAAILVAYPNLSASAVNPDDPLGLRGLALDPTSADTDAFVDGLFGEMAALFPDAYFHVGGDEVSAAAWNANASIRRYMADQGLADAAALQAHFFRRVKATLDRHGKRTVGWEEVAGRPLEDDVIVQSWRSSQAIAHITGQGNRAIVSAGYYLDLLWPGLRHYAIDPLDLTAVPPGAAGDVLGPPPDGALDAQRSALVLGAEAPLWTEVVTDEMVDGRLWPRSALLAERFWSPAEVRDPVGASRRLVVVHEGLRLEGLADDATRHRMAARLAPSDAAAVETLAAATVPVRNFGRLADVVAAVRSGQPIHLPELTSLVDVAAPDSLEIHRLDGRVEQFLAGEAQAADTLRAELTALRDNHARFVAVAGGRPSLEPAIAVSADLAALAQCGLDAVDAIGRRAHPGRRWQRRVDALLERQAAAQAASDSIAKVMSGAVQPPAKLLIGITPAISRLVRAAGTPH